MPEQSIDDEIDLGDLFQTILGEWRILVATFFVTLGLAGLYAYVLAPSEYRATASIRGMSANFCPYEIQCQLTLPEALSEAGAFLSTPAGRDAISINVLASQTVGVVSERGAADISVVTTPTNVTITATDESGGHAVATANAAVRALEAQLAAILADNLDTARTLLQLRLNALVAPTAIETDAAQVIALERADLNAQLATVDLARTGPATTILSEALPAERVAPRRSLIVTLGGIMGLFLGAGVAIIAALRSGRLHAPGAIATAFGGEAPLIGDATAIQAGAPHSLWQEVRVSVGDAALPVIALAGDVHADTLRQAAIGLCSEFARSGQAAAIVDLGGWFPSDAAPSDLGPQITMVKAADGVAAYACKSADLRKAVAALTDQGRVVVILAPAADADLPLMRDVFLTSTARVFLARRGHVTRQDAGRIMMAERGAVGARVVAVV